MPRPKQNDLPIEGEGVAPKKIKKLDIAADDYVEKRDTRMQWTEKEADAKAVLIQLMIEHKLERYRFGDQEVVLKPGSAGVKVKTVDSVGGDEEEGESED